METPWPAEVRGLVVARALAVVLGEAVLPAAEVAVTVLREAIVIQAAVAIIPAIVKHL